MAEETLSQAEVESLLNAGDSGLGRGGNSGVLASHPASRFRERIVPYDFKRPERVGKEQMRGLQSLHEGFARNFGAAISAMLRTIVEVKLTSVDQLTYGEFVFSLENPTCFNLLSAEPLEGNLILDINPAILFPIIDRLLGGGKNEGPIARRPLTEIELRLVSRITTLFLAELQKAWLSVVQLELKVSRVESNPQLVQIVPPNEVVVLISFEISLGEARGMVNLCIPYTAIERVASKLTANTWSGYERVASSPETVAKLTRQLRHAVVQMVVTLAESRMTTSDLIGLRVGDIITTDKDVHSPLEVRVEGLPKFRASAGAFKGHKAFQVQEVLTIPPTSPTP